MRLLGYSREEESKWYHTREIVYWIYKTIPEKRNKISKEQFFPLGKKREKGARLDDRQKEILMQAIKESINGEHKRTEHSN